MKCYQNYPKSLLALCLFVLSFQTTAGEIDARTYIVNLTNQLQVALNEGLDQGLLEDEAYLDAVIDEHILPHVDNEYLSRRVFHPRWDDIATANKSAEAQNAIISSLRRTYRVALTSYNGQKIEIGKSRDKAKYSVVRAKVYTNNNIHLMDFALRLADGEWRVFDLSVDGVVFSKTLNGSIRRNLENDDVDSVINAITPDES
ncbi:MAG: MlaC/ttg2D family ABC transporter substrate-binding protein [Neptuniibacter sp.]